MPNNNECFRRRRPAVFWFMILAAALVLVWGTKAALLSGNLFREATGPKLGLVRIEGTIVDPEKIDDWIKELREDDDVKGVVVRINSPGGVVGPSQEIYEAVKRLAGKKPVVASMGAVAASGGYYVACPATEIIANPGTLTGSIGVKAELVNAQNLLDKVGVTFFSVTSGKLKDAGCPFRPMTDEEKAYFESMVQDLKRQFVRDVAAGRKMDPARIDELADGRAYSGEQALAVGLVDKMGGLEDAFDDLKKLCNLEGKVPLLTGPKKEKRWLRDLLESSLGHLDLDSLMNNTFAGARVSYE
ncbi:MAG: signal peptide peptidase SppA [Desulfovibrionaceae bacterium]|nr:signal peptide peptidase SppA [Desulfovibrionaceae bacterium]MBF0515290.1 signal peptide peptidase SppA [Desulfovibrionaceae bacterium]